MKLTKLPVLNPRDAFQRIRNQEKDRFSLRLRMTLIITAELILSIGIALCIYFLLQPLVKPDSPWLLLLTLFLTSGIIGGGVTSLVSKGFVLPIKKLGKAMEQIADGDYAVRLDEQSSSREIMEVYTGFNMMAHELGSTEMLQSDFVSNVSHEFKTPINAIEGYSMLLQGGDNLTEDQQVYVEKILFNTQRLSSLVGSILLLSKLENQSIPQKQSRFSLDEQIRQSIVALETRWEPKDIEFDVDMERIDYTGNEPMIRHVWDNLIGNAIKFDPPCGLIRIRLNRHEGNILFTIDDSGPGLSEEAAKHLFDKFYQEDSSHKQEGNGLGLSLVKRILTLEEGEVSAENLPGGGCRFTVRLKEK